MLSEYNKRSKGLGNEIEIFYIEQDEEDCMVASI